MGKDINPADKQRKDDRKRELKKVTVPHHTHVDCPNVSPPLTPIHACTPFNS